MAKKGRKQKTLFEALMETAKQYSPTTCAHCMSGEFLDCAVVVSNWTEHPIPRDELLSMTELRLELYKEGKAQQKSRTKKDTLTLHVLRKPGQNGNKDGAA